LASGGGFASLDYAAWHPESLRSLIVAASTGQISDWLPLVPSR
jgi:pimeloyl-ACP methyl ester carboxylesterase